MAGKKLKNKEADKKVAEAAVKEAVKEKSEVMVLPEKKAELKVVETKAPVKDAKPVAEVNASDVKESKALEDVKPVKRGRKKAEETATPGRRGRKKADETAKPAKRGRKKAEDKETEEPKKADKNTAKKETNNKEIKAEKKTRKASKAAKTELKEPAKRGRKKAEVKETKDNVEQVAAMINKEITKEVKKSKKAAPEKKKILFVGSEVLPFAATGGLGEVLGSLPKALAARGDYDVRVMMPYYSDIGEQYRNSAKYLCNYNVGLSWRNLYCGLFELKQDNVTYYFIDNEYYFHRDGLYGFYDDGERYAFFCKAVMDSFYFIDFMPDIIHANDWQTALIPIYNNSKYHYDIKLIFTIHNIEYQGQYDLKILPTVFDLPPEAGAYVE